MKRTALLLLVTVGLGSSAGADESAISSPNSGYTWGGQGRPAAQVSGSQSGSASTRRNSSGSLGTQTDTSLKPSVSLTIDTSSTLASGAYGAQSAGTDFSQSGFYRLDASIPLPGSFVASIRGGYSQEYTYVQDDGTPGGFVDTRLGLARKAGEIVKNLSLSLATSLSLPTSRDSQRAHMKSAAGFGLPLVYKKGRWEFDLSPAYTQFFHDVEVQDNGTPNNEESISLGASLSYNFTRKFSASTTYLPSRSWSYEGISHDKYIAAAELDYQFTKLLGSSIGIMTNASALKSNGLDYNYVIYDQSQTTGYFDIIITM